jgi:hypothetical protein
MIIVISTGVNEVYFHFHEQAENFRDVASAPSNNILSHCHTVLWSGAVSSFALWAAGCHCAHATVQETGALSVASQSGCWILSHDSVHPRFEPARVASIPV